MLGGTTIKNPGIAILVLMLREKGNAVCLFWVKIFVRIDCYFFIILIIQLSLLMLISIRKLSIHDFELSICAFYARGHMVVIMLIMPISTF